MSTKEKLIERFKRCPNDFTFEELARVFSSFGFTLNNKGATSGSRVRFEKGDDYIISINLIREASSSKVS